MEGKEIVETYKINIGDKLNVETSIYVYITELKNKNKELQKSIEINLSTIKSLRKTELKIRGCFYSEEEPDIYDEKLKGIWEHIN